MSEQSIWLPTIPELKHPSKFYVTGEFRYEGDFEKKFDNLDDAFDFAGMVIDEGGYADVTDDIGCFYTEV